MTQAENYPNAGSVESAIRDAARTSAAADPSLSTSTRISLEYFHRFLCRVFSEGEGSEWVLKGGTGMLARVPSTRATRDIDLTRAGFNLDQSLDELRRLSAIDLGDHFRFEYVGHTATIGNDNQPYTEGLRVTFKVFVGVNERGTLKVDLAAGASITGKVVSAEPASSLNLPRLVNHPYRLYPVVDQIADKVCATLMEYKSRASSREKDLVDLVVLATTHKINGAELSMAITTEIRRRRMDPFGKFTVPTAWGTGYAKLAKPVPYCAEFRTIESATDLVTRMINPVLSGEAEHKTWSPESMSWQ